MLYGDLFQQPRDKQSVLGKEEQLQGFLFNNTRIFDNLTTTIKIPLTDRYENPTNCQKAKAQK